MNRVLGLICVVFVCTSIVQAQSKNEGKGQFAFVINDGAPLYKDSEGDAVARELAKWDPVAGIQTTARIVDSYQFEDENGRVHVFTLTEKGLAQQGWMNRSDLSPYFTYECGCGLTQAKCSPHVLERLHYKWNICFEEARQAKLADLQKAPAAPAAQAAPAESAEERLKKLKSMFDKGLITKDEYDKKRAEILKSM